MGQINQGLLMTPNVCTLLLAAASFD